MKYIPYIIIAPLIIIVALFIVSVYMASKCFNPIKYLVCRFIRKGCIIKEIDQYDGVYLMGACVYCNRKCIIN